MITEQALQEAIAECQGQRDPNRDTCMMLAAFYTIQDHLYPAAERSGIPSQLIDRGGYSFASSTDVDSAETVGDYGDSEFLQAVRGQDAGKMWAIMDELMDTLKIVNQRAYNGIMRKIQ